MKKKRYNKYDVILIKWLDSVHDSGWKRENELDDEGEIEYETVGLYIGETKRTIKVVQSKCCGTSIENNYLVDALMQIPKVAILNIKKLR